ncbi:MAG: adenylyltransferase/cytidyltransferase family protein [Patescibacteria group bacterium]
MIVKIEKAIDISKKLRKEGRVVVLAGGCFDILHSGHTRFLKESKKQGNKLFVLLENDVNVAKLKGANRPINTQKERAEVLSDLRSVDYVVLLPVMEIDNDYDKLLLAIRPEVITTTENDPDIEHKKRQAKMIKAKLVSVIGRIEDRSTSRINDIISKK